MSVKVREYDDRDLDGKVIITLKIDGVQVIKTKNGFVSRKDKPLYNVPDFDGEVAEIFLGSWSKTVSACRTQNSTLIPKEAIYTLVPLDPRLIIAEMDDPTGPDIYAHFNAAIRDGYEGLVLIHSSGLWKMKTIKTYDVKVTGLIEGTGKFKGMLGAVTTDKGKVGTGFKQDERDDFWKHKNKILGETIEVKCMGLTPDGKFRHPRFLKLRFDK